jgi:hypothetical protein
MTSKPENWLLQLYELENDLKILLNLEEPLSERTADKNHSLINIAVDSLNLRLYRLFQDLSKLQKEYAKFKVKTTEDSVLSGDEILAKFVSSAFLVVLLRLVLEENCNTSNAAAILERLALGVDDNLVSEVNTLLKLLMKDDE